MRVDAGIVNPSGVNGSIFAILFEVLACCSIALGFIKNKINPIRIGQASQYEFFNSFRTIVFAD
jgi:hypothetical protein